jgi:hypothetical protein
MLRHKNMSLVKKLKASDFTLAEGGVPQTIKTFHFVSGREARLIAQQP